LAKLFNIDRPAILPNASGAAKSGEQVDVGESLRWRKGGTNLVCLMVVLWVVLEDLGLLSVLKIPDEIVHSELLPPLFVGNKPIAPALSAYPTLTRNAGSSTQCY
jgi:hypothetical protein